MIVIFSTCNSKFLKILQLEIEIFFEMILKLQQNSKVC